MGERQRQNESVRERDTKKERRTDIQTTEKELSHAARQLFDLMSCQGLIKIS